MSETICERGMLKTRVPERGLCVTTSLGLERPDDPEARGHRWTAIWAGPSARCVYLQFWRGQTSPGGVAEAHAWVVDEARRGALPDGDTDLLGSA